MKKRKADLEHEQVLSKDIQKISNELKKWETYLKGLCYSLVPLRLGNRQFCGYPNKETTIDVHIDCVVFQQMSAYELSSKAKDYVLDQDRKNQRRKHSQDISSWHQRSVSSVPQVSIQFTWTQEVKHLFGSLGHCFGEIETASKLGQCPMRMFTHRPTWRHNNEIILFGEEETRCTLDLKLSTEHDTVEFCGPRWDAPHGWKNNFCIRLCLEDIQDVFFAKFHKQERDQRIEEGIPFNFPKPLLRLILAYLP
jgi:hypothetical protein